MAREIVYTFIRDLVLNGAIDFTSAGLTPVKRVLIYSRDYQEEREKQPLPPRPVLLIEFGTTDWRYEAGKKRGTLPVILHLVQDCYAEGRSGNQGEQKYLELLQYPDWLSRYLEDKQVAGFGYLRHKRSEPDHDHGNLLVDRLHFEIDIKG